MWAPALIGMAEQLANHLIPFFVFLVCAASSFTSCLYCKPWVLLLLLLWSPLPSQMSKAAWGLSVVKPWQIQAISWQLSICQQGDQLSTSPAPSQTYTASLCFPPYLSFPPQPVFLLSHLPACLKPLSLWPDVCQWWWNSSVGPSSLHALAGFLVGSVVGE